MKLSPPTTAPAWVWLFNRSCISVNGLNDDLITSSTIYHCHTRRTKKLAVENGNPNMVWSGSEDGTLRQHNFWEDNTCPLARSSCHESHNVLVIVEKAGSSDIAKKKNDET